VDAPPRTRFSLLSLVTSALVGLILVATLSVAATTYLATTRTVDGLWNALAETLADRTAQETLRFLEPALPWTKATAGAMRTGQLDASDNAAVLRWMEIALQAHPQFTWASFGRADGTYLSVYRWPDADGTEHMRRTSRTVDPAEAATLTDGMALAHFNDHERNDDGSWRPLNTPGRRYDPRKRPWYLDALKSAPGHGRWQKPYVFTSRQQTGVAYSRPVRDGTGRLLGVVAAEFEAAPLSRFLRAQKVGRSGRVYLVAESGVVIGHPGYETVHLADGKLVNHLAASHPDPMLSGAWKARGTLDDEARKHPFSFGPYLAMARSFDTAADLPWVALTVVPADDLYGSVKRQTRDALLIAAAVALVAILVAFLVSRSLSRAVGRVNAQMHRAASFELEGDDEAAIIGSPIREVHEMGAAVAALKHGLRSFSRYVPYQLVRHLLRSGQEARLGGEEREMTVLFSDIAGFTTVVEATPAPIVLSALGDYLHRMNLAIGETGGTVCQYLGDAIMAFWGAPDPQPDHAIRACRGALRMREEAESLLQTARDEGKPPLPTRFGVNSGDVMVGNIGAPDRFNYAILGDPVNAAARLEGLNKVYGTSIIVGERTAELVGDAMVLRQLDWVRAKGKSQALAVFELVGEKGHVDQDKLEDVTSYAVALKAYRNGNFAEAAQGFSRLALGGDSAATVLADRCRLYADIPPPGDWDGAFTMTSK